MNANEIADGLAQMYIEKDVNGLFNKRIQNMLRKQAEEIEYWKEKFNKAMEMQEINNEPAILKKKAVKTYTEGNPNYVTKINNKQYDAIDNTEPRSSNTCGR
jgi:uncharacterized membrane protein YheB (UPF0754 family)